MARINDWKKGQAFAIFTALMAAVILITSLTIHEGIRRVNRAKVMIAADSGAMYLNSLCGSYAKYLSCNYIGCKSKKCKKNWFAIIMTVVAVIALATAFYLQFVASPVLSGAGAVSPSAIEGLAVSASSPFYAAPTLGGLTAGQVAFVGVSAALSAGVSEYQYGVMAKDLNKQFAKLNENVRFRYQVMYYVMSQLVEDTAFQNNFSEYLDEVVEQSEQVNHNVQNFIEEEMYDFFISLESLSPALNPAFLDNGILDKVSQKAQDACALSGRCNSDSMSIPVETRIFVDEDNTDCANPEDCFDGNETYKITDWIVYDLWDKNVLSYTSWHNNLYETYGSPEAIAVNFPNWADQLYDYDNPNADYSDDWYHVFSEDIRMLQEIDDIFCPGGIIEKEMEGILDNCYEHPEGGFYVGAGCQEAADTMLMLADVPWQQIQNLRTRLEQYQQDINTFYSNIMDDYESLLIDSYQYTWKDKLERTHGVNVFVDYKMPKIKTKKKTFKVCIYLKNYAQEISVTAQKDNYSTTSKAKYHYKDMSEWQLN